jgi:hypothetical protein
MSEFVEVPFGDNPEEAATLLLAAAEESKDHSAADVRTISGSFLVPKALADKAGVKGSAREKPSLALKEADIPDGLVETYKMGAGPTGEVDTNAGDDAVSGTVQNEQGEQKMGEPARDTVLNDEGEDKPKPKKAAKKSAPKKSASKDKE